MANSTPERQFEFTVSIKYQVQAEDPAHALLKLFYELSYKYSEFDPASLRMEELPFTPIPSPEEVKPTNDNPV